MGVGSEAGGQTQGARARGAGPALLTRESCVPLRARSPRAHAPGFSCELIPSSGNCSLQLSPRQSHNRGQRGQSEEKSLPGFRWGQFLPQHTPGVAPERARPHAEPDAADGRPVRTPRSNHSPQATSTG